MSRLIFLCGHAGAGKTTLAKRAVPLLHARSGQSYCLLDKDTVYGSYSQRVMGLLTGDPNDRDSPTYLEHLRDPEYHGLIDIARENVALGVNVVVVAPFSRELKSGLLFDPQRLRLPVGCDVRVVWVGLDETTARRRIIERGDERDWYKLAHWEQYRLRRFSPDPAEYPQLLFFDNSRFDDQRFERLIDALLSKVPVGA
ncbi:MAG TPA: AAA family ATPase [Burkholderiaceae bacterium]|nr:AAA family ATPase [Burkholderiaceae bacterium]